MFEMMPFGLMDATLGGAALILMLTQYFGNQKIIDNRGKNEQNENNN